MPTIDELVDELVAAAQQNGGFSFTQTLLRVGGIERDDPFETCRADLTNGHAISKPRETYCRWSRRDDFLRFTWNLVESSEGRPFNSYALFDLAAPVHLGQRNSVTERKVAHLLQRLADAKREGLASLIADLFPQRLLEGCAEEQSDDTTYREVAARLAALYGALLSASDRERRKFIAAHRFFRWPQFEVLELLVNDTTGLYGYRVHFSNGSHAEFARLPKGTDALNITFERDGQVNYFVGSLDHSRKEWRVGNKRLFEVGLPGRYNELGKWKPIVYEGPTEEFTREVRAASDDPDVQGALFYIYTTAHRVVEFAARTTVDLPIENVVSFGPTRHPLRLWKVPITDHARLSERLYDGWISVEAPTVEAIQEALAHIRIGMSRLAFVFDAQLHWSLKYSMTREIQGVAKPKEDDLPKFDEVLVNDVPPVLDLAMSWVNAGRNASDPLTSFLCHFNAIEVVVEAVWEDDLEVAAGPIQRETKAERLASRRACMKAAMERHFPNDPNSFAQEVYFNCFKRLAKRRRDVAEHVWGSEHAAVKDLFERVEDGLSLADIRDAVAHGKVSLLDTDDIKMVKKRLPRLAQIAKAMIIRVLLKKRADEPIAFWSGQHTVDMNMTDPRNTMVANTLKMFPGTDWPIKAEWIGA